MKGRSSKHVVRSAKKRQTWTTWTDQSSPADLILLPRTIRKFGSDMEACMVLLEKVTIEYRDHVVLLQPVFLAALEVLHQSVAAPQGQPSSETIRQSVNDIALKLYQDCPTESVRAKAISVCGSDDNCKNNNCHSSTLMTLLSLHPPPGIAAINAALAAFARRKDWMQARLVLLAHASLVSTMSCNIVLLAMERAHQTTEALDLLQQMMMMHNATLPKPDRNSFHHTIRAARSGNVVAVDNAYKLMDIMHSCSILPTNTTFDILASAYSRLGDWTMVGLVDSLRFDRNTVNRCSFPDPERYRLDAKANQQEKTTIHWNSCALGLKQVRFRNEAWWEFACYEHPSTRLRVALQPHRHPSKNGIKILLFADNDYDDTNDDKLRKVGFLLMINRRADTSSTMLGVFIHPDLRRLGFSKTIVSIWLDLCRHAGLTPRTGVINKPLLALVLQHRFRFVPCEWNTTTRVEVEVSPGTNGTVALYAPHMKSMHGVFTSWDLKRERIELLDRPPSPRGRLCRIKTAFILRNDSLLPNYCDKIHERLVYHSYNTPWRSVFLGD